jgi:Tol biopolymer transport system component
MSPDGTMAVYTSDRTGIMQVYVVRIPEQLRARLATPQPDAAPGGRLPDKHY